MPLQNNPDAVAEAIRRPPIDTMSRSEIEQELAVFRTGHASIAAARMQFVSAVVAMTRCANETVQAIPDRRIREAVASVLLPFAQIMADAAEELNDIDNPALPN